MSLKDVYYKLLDNGNDDIAASILKGRGLENTFGAIYIPEGTRVNGIEVNAGVLSPVFIKDVFRGGVYREMARKQFYRMLDNVKYPVLYNIDNALKDTSFVILTESIYDCQSIIQSLGINNVVSKLTASLKTDQLISLFAIFSKIYCYFDNDNSGIGAYDKLTSFRDEYYPDKEVELILLKGAKDANEYLTKYGKDKLAKEIVRQML